MTMFRAVGWLALGLLQFVLVAVAASSLLHVGYRIYAASGMLTARSGTGTDPLSCSKQEPLTDARRPAAPTDLRAVLMQFRRCPISVSKSTSLLEGHHD